MGLGGSPGLVVMGGDSRSKGRGFESRRRILDGHFFTLICCKNCIVCLKKTENKRKRGRDGPFFKKRNKEYDGTSVTRFGEISPLWQNDLNLRPVAEGLFIIWQNFGPTFAKRFLDSFSML